MTYSLYLFYGHTNKGDNCIEHVQRLAARHMLNRYDIPNDQLIAQTGWQSIMTIAHVQRLRMAYDYYYGLKPMPPDILKMTPPAQPLRRSSRLMKTLHVHQLYHNIANPLLVSSRQCAIRQICSEWNNMDSDSVTMTRRQFRTYVKSLL
jgi:hypothetical protein